MKLVRNILAVITMLITASLAVAQTVSTVPLYRLYAGGGNLDHLYTTDLNEVNSAVSGGYAYEGIVGYVLSAHHASLGTVPLYRYFSDRAGVHFYTTDWNEIGTGAHGYRYEGIQCYVAPSQISGTVPFFRFCDPLGVHFYTTSPELETLTKESEREWHVSIGSHTTREYNEQTGQWETKEHSDLTFTYSSTDTSYRLEGVQCYIWNSEVSFEIPPAQVNDPAWGNVIGDTIYAGTELRANDSLLSPNKRYLAIFQQDGNFVVYRTPDMHGLWATNTENRGANLCAFQTDGNLVVYTTWEAQNGYWDSQYNDETGEWESVYVEVEGTHTEYYGRWHTATHNQGGNRLVIQDDGNLVIYTQDGRCLWHIGLRG
jgi:hypothetical protein